MTKSKRHKKIMRVVRPVTQCDTCQEGYCRESVQQECAKQEFMALAEGRTHECPDRVAGYWERMEAA